MSLFETLGWAGMLYIIALPAPLIMTMVEVHPGWRTLKQNMVLYTQIYGVTAAIVGYVYVMVQLTHVLLG